MVDELSRRRFLTRSVGMVPPLLTLGTSSWGEGEPNGSRQRNTLGEGGALSEGEPNEPNGSNEVGDGKSSEPSESNGPVGRWLAEPVGGPVVVLRRGGLLCAAIDWAMESSGSRGAKELGKTTFSLSGWSQRTWGIPLSSVAGVVMNPPSDPRQRDRLWDRVRSDATLGVDGLRLVDGDRVTGRNLWYHAAGTAIPEGITSTERRTTTSGTASTASTASTARIAGIAGIAGIASTAGFTIDTAWGREWIESGRVIVAIWGAETFYTYTQTRTPTEPPRDASWVGLRDGSFFAIEEPPAREAERAMGTSNPVESAKGFEEASNLVESTEISKIAKDAESEETKEEIAKDWIAKESDTIPFMGGGRVDAAEAEWFFYRPRIDGRRTLSGMEPDVFESITPFGATLAGDQSPRWGRDRTPDGMAIRERGRLVPFGITQPVGSRLGFPLDPAYTGVFYARFSLVPMGGTDSAATSVAGIGGTFTTRRMSRRDELRGTPIRVQVLVNGQVSQTWLESTSGYETSAWESRQVEIPVRSATRIDFVVDAGESGLVPIRPWIAQWAEGELRIEN